MSAFTPITAPLPLSRAQRSETSRFALAPCSSKPSALVVRRKRVQASAETGSGGGDENANRNEERERALARMRERLEGLFGDGGGSGTVDDGKEFDGEALRQVVKDRWGVQYDVQPQKRHGRVYIQVMWRYFEQQSFYLGEDEFAAHCEAVAQLLAQWNAVDYFCDYVMSVKKRPVVGITINIPIPNIEASSAAF